MGWWDDQVVARVAARLLGSRTVSSYRERVCAGLAGTVLEIGFGTGTNVPWYPAGVRRVLAVDPSDAAWSRSGTLRAASPVQVLRAGADAQSIPLDDASVDFALTTFTLCTVPDPVAALCEVARVLRQGGTLHLLEHGLAGEERVARRQRSTTRWWPHLAGGCHLDRDVPAMCEEAGLHVVRMATSEPAMPRVFFHLYEGEVSA